MSCHKISLKRNLIFCPNICSAYLIPVNSSLPKRDFYMIFVGSVKRNKRKMNTNLKKKIVKQFPSLICTH